MINKLRKINKPEIDSQKIQTNLIVIFKLHQTIKTNYNTSTKKKNIEIKNTNLIRTLAKINVISKINRISNLMIIIKI